MSNGEERPRARDYDRSQEFNRGPRDRYRYDREREQQRRQGDYRSRGWNDRNDRDRGHRRDEGRYDDGFSRRDGWRGGQSRGGRRYRSRSPPERSHGFRHGGDDGVKIDTVPINERVRKNSKWDIKPNGYDDIPINAAKLSGNFPRPGAPKQGVTFGDQKSAETAIRKVKIADIRALYPSRALSTRRLIVSLSTTQTASSIKAYAKSYLSSIMPAEKTESKNDDDLEVSVTSPSQDKVILEFQTAEQATLIGAMNGSPFDQENGEPSTFVINRPEDYITPDEKIEAQSVISVPDLDLRPKNVKLPEVPDGPDKIYVSNVPPFLEKSQVLDLLGAFGEITGSKIYEKVNGELLGTVLCKYGSVESADAACEGLNNMELGGNVLHTGKANKGLIQNPSVLTCQTENLLDAARFDPAPSSTVIQLFNAITTDDLAKEGEVEDIEEDIKRECSKAGKVIEVRIPRTAKTRLGKALVKFDAVEDASKALKMLGGRSFCGRTLITAYLPLENFELGIY